MIPALPKRFAPFTEYEIDLFLVGDASAELRTRIEEHAASHEDFRELLRTEQGARDAFFVTHPTLGVPEISESRRRVVWAPLLGLAALAGLLWVVVPMSDSDSGGVGTPEIRVRGALKVAIYVSRDARVFEWTPETHVIAGDRLRLSIEHPKPGFAYVFSRESGKPWQTVYEATPTRAGSFTLPGSRILDGSLAPEQWLVLLKQERLPAASIIERLERNESLDGVHTSITLKKDGRPK